MRIWLGIILGGGIDLSGSNPIPDAVMLWGSTATDYFLWGSDPGDYLTWE